MTSKLKRILFENALCSQSLVKIVLIAAPGLELPDGYRYNGVALEYGLNTQIPIPDLEINEAGISAVLSFNKKPVKTFVPWQSVVKISAEGCFISLWPIEVDADEPSKPITTRPFLKMV